jgi:hypothetical protein
VCHIILDVWTSFSEISVPFDEEDSLKMGPSSQSEAMLDDVLLQSFTHS